MNWAFLVLILCTGASSARACVADGRPLIANKPSSDAIVAQLEPITVSRPFQMKLTVCSDSTPAVDQLKVDAWMPRHKHGMKYSTTVQSLGAGEFTVSNMVFHMPGFWQVRVSTQQQNVEASYVLDITVK